MAWGCLASKSPSFFFFLTSSLGWKRIAVTDYWKQSCIISNKKRKLHNQLYGRSLITDHPLFQTATKMTYHRLRQIPSLLSNCVDFFLTLFNMKIIICSSGFQNCSLGFFFYKLLLIYISVYAPKSIKKQSCCTFQYFSSLAIYRLYWLTNIVALSGWKLLPSL